MLYVPIRSEQPSRDSCKLLYKYVPIRSVYVPPCFVKNLSESYTFLHVPCNPLAILANCYTFLYGPYTFRIRSALCLNNLSEGDAFLYVPHNPSRISCELLRIVIRSYTFLNSSQTFLQVILKKVPESYMFLYVPITFLDVPASNLEECVPKLYVPIHSVQPLWHFLQMVMSTRFTGDGEVLFERVHLVSNLCKEGVQSKSDLTTNTEASVIFGKRTGGLKVPMPCLAPEQEMGTLS